jgi:chitodextrinase
MLEFEGPIRFASGTGAAVVMAMYLAAPSAAFAARDRKPPTTPTNLRVTAVTSYSVALAWDPSTDNSGRFSYVICCANVSSQTVPGGVSSFTYTAGLEAGRSFTLRIQAVDAAGNWSKPSNSVTFTTPPDTIPPTRPLVSVTNVGATFVSLMWSTIEDGPHVWYSVFANGDAVLYGTRETSTTLTLLQPETTYTFTVQARDFGGNSSPLSDPVTATTGATNPDDVTPPTTPGNLRAGSWGDCEVELDWDESTDDLDPQWLIEYQVYVNGVYDHSLSQRYTRTIVYGTQNGANTFAVIAVDTAGNRSDPAEVVENLTCEP